MSPEDASHNHDTLLFQLSDMEKQRNLIIEELVTVKAANEAGRKAYFMVLDHFNQQKSASDEQIEGLVRSVAKMSALIKEAMAMIREDRNAIVESNSLRNEDGSLNESSMDIAVRHEVDEIDSLLEEMEEVLSEALKE